jgi:hypothetical protein
MLRSQARSISFSEWDVTLLDRALTKTRLFHPIDDQLCPPVGCPDKTTSIGRGAGSLVISYQVAAPSSVRSSTQPHSTVGLCNVPNVTWSSPPLSHLPLLPSPHALHFLPLPPPAQFTVGLRARRGQTPTQLATWLNPRINSSAQGYFSSRAWSHCFFGD